MFVCAGARGAFTRESSGHKVEAGLNSEAGLKFAETLNPKP